MKDLEGREYAKLSELTLGDTVEVGAGFSCIDLGAKRGLLRAAAPWGINVVNMDRGAA